MLIITLQAAAHRLQLERQVFPQGVPTTPNGPVQSYTTTNDLTYLHLWEFIDRFNTGERVHSNPAAISVSIKRI